MSVSSLGPKERQSCTEGLRNDSGVGGLTCVTQGCDARWLPWKDVNLEVAEEA